MARLHEYQGKQQLAKEGVLTPHGAAATTPDAARTIAAEIGRPVMVKAQVWVTGRAGLGAIRKAATPDEAALIAEALLGQRIKNLTVTEVLVEEQLDIAREFYAGVIVDDRAQAPLVIFSSAGGTGIEEIAVAHPDKVARTHVDIERGFLDYQARDLVRRTGISGKLQSELGDLLVRLYQVARGCEARSAEINPLVLTAEGKLVAADCRITVDDYAVFRHPELGIEIAREYDRPPTPLEKIAYAVEAQDYRGTFYFIQMAEGFQRGEGYIGFHGAGGGGSMMSMDALLRQGFKVATFVDTSGNPPASKVYRAAKIVLAVGPIDGYFSSGSGVASQEQFYSARGFFKAFLEAQVEVPIVVRLGGNGEDRAVEILEGLNGRIPAPVEGYKKDDSPDFCVQRLATLIGEQAEKRESEKAEKREGEKAERRKGEKAGERSRETLYTFPGPTGTVTLDHALCATCASKVCVEACARHILALNAEGLPVLAITPEEAQKGRCVECLACEVDCLLYGAGGGHVDLPIAGLDA